MASHRSLSLIPLLLIVASFVTPIQAAHAAWLIDNTGSIVQVDPAVLGDDSEHDAVEVTNTEQATPTPSPVSDHVELTAPTPTASPNRDEKRTLEENTAKRKFAQEQAARKKKLELTKQMIKNKVDVKNNKIQISSEHEDTKGKVTESKQVELPENEPLHVEQPDGSQLEVSPTANSELEIKGEKVRTRTHMPVTIGANNALIITKKDGTQKTVAFLPDQAVANLEAKGFTVTNTTTELSESSTGEMVYTVEAKKEKKLFGLFRTEFSQESQVSAETGDVVSTTSTESSPLRRWLERLAI
jgi:hypothetical protein